MKTLLSLLVLAASLTATAQQPKRCVTCGVPVGATYYNFTSPTLGSNQPACEPCSKLTNRCVICKLPILDTARKLEDGRFFCDSDFKSGVFDVNEARRVYEEVRRDIAGLLSGYGPLPDGNITVALVNGAEMKKLQQTLPSEHDGKGTLGLTRTESVGRKHFQHRIHLLNGLPRNRLASVCAHEYAHTWIHENVPVDRKLEKDTVEGFCELVAYKLMVQRRDEQQKKIILDNAYTRGQVNAFIEAEHQHRFHRVVSWLKTGVDESLLQTNKVQLVTGREDDPSVPSWAPPPPNVPTRVPDTLILKGISGAAVRRFALINDATLAKNEEGKVRVGSTNVVVRCLDIHAASVVIQIKGAARPTELFLTSKD